MGTEITKEIKHAVVVEAKDLETLDRLLRDGQMKVTYTLKCKDGSRISPDSVERLLEFDNPKSREIIEFRLRARTTTDEEVFCRIDKGSFLLAPSIKVEVTASDDSKALILSSRILSILEGMKPTYSPFARFRPFTILWVTSIAYTILMTTLKVLGVISFTPAMPASISWLETYNVALALVILLIALVALVEVVWRLLFPRVFFAIGKGKRRNEGLSKWRWLLLAGCIFAVPVGILVNFLSDRIR